MFTKKTVKDIDIDGKTVLMHGELDAPLNSEGTEVTSDFRIKASIPTIKYLQEHGCRIVLISKLGRPDGKVDPKQSLKPVAKRLSKLLGEEVAFVNDCIGEEVKKTCAKLKPGQVVMLENLRFYPEEEADDQNFAKQMAVDTGAKVFVQDCFALAHRKEAGNTAISKCLPAVAGLHLEQEVVELLQVMENPKRPLMALIGGAKISDKIELINRFMDIADIVAIGGAMANTFVLAEGVKVGKSKVEKDNIEIAKDIMAKARKKAKNGSFVFYVPQDGVAAISIESAAKTRIVDWGTHVIADIENYPKTPPKQASLVDGDEMILDIGPFSAAFIAGSMQLAGTVIWNGTMGVTEVKSLQTATGPFSHGTEAVVEAMLGQFGHRPYTVVGGGDTVGYVTERGLEDHFNHVSAGGGAGMDLMSGKTLPAVEALLDKDK